MPLAYSPKISICIPAYNQTIYLKRLFQSIQLQEFTDYEIIITDDSSTYEVRDFVAGYNFGGKLKYFRNQNPLGSPANWNAAMEKATGKYVKIMHHDDAFAGKDALGEMVDHLETNGYDYLFCNTRIENIKHPNRSRTHQIKNLDKIIRKSYLLFFGNRIGAPSTLLLRRELSQQLNYDTRYIWLVDMEYYIRLFQQSSNGSFIPRPLVITHTAMEERLTTVILADFDLQIKEHIMLYNYLTPHTLDRVTRWFMQVSLARLFFRAKAKNKDLLKSFDVPPAALKTYFSLLRFKPLYFAYYVAVRVLDLLRKSVY